MILTFILFLTKVYTYSVYYKSLCAYILLIFFVSPVRGCNRDPKTAAVLQGIMVSVSNQSMDILIVSVTAPLVSPSCQLVYPSCLIAQ